MKRSKHNTNENSRREVSYGKKTKGSWAGRTLSAWRTAQRGSWFGDLLEVQKADSRARPETSREIDGNEPRRHKASIVNNSRRGDAAGRILSVSGRASSGGSLGEYHEQRTNRY